MIGEKEMERYLGAWARLQESSLGSLIRETEKSYLEEQDKGISESEWLLGVEPCPHFKDHSELHVYWRTGWDGTGTLIFEIHSRLHEEFGPVWLAHWALPISLTSRGLQTGPIRHYGRFSQDPRLLTWALRRGQEILDRFLEQLRRRREGIRGQKDYLEALEWLQSLTILMS